MTENLVFKYPEPVNKKAFETMLGEHGVFGFERAQKQTGKIMDTFDWRLYRAGWWLFQTSDDLLLRDFNGQRLVRARPGSKAAYAWDLPEGRLREIISPIIEMRALLELAVLEISTYPFRMLNQDQKTVARVALQLIRLPDRSPDGQQFSYARLSPVRGYPRHARRLESGLQESGAAPSSAADMYFSSLEASGRSPGDYSAKLKFQLDPDMRADEATKVILRFLAGVMRANEAGVKADIDTEFLHDFRVAMRRTRSALTQIKGVFPPEIVNRFKGDFASLGRLTNPLRDLDVYLLSEEAYKSMLPAALRSDIDPLFAHLRDQRQQALAAVVEGLEARRYAKIMGDWERFLNSPVPDDPTAPNAQSPVVRLARRRINKRYKVIVKSGTEILENTQDELLHALRIECKKLRYLMEFFASLFPADEISYLIKQLKLLQDNLGDFNDLSVQESYLLDIANELPADDAANRRTLLAIGGLVEALDEKQTRVKGDFAGTFCEFASNRNQALFKALFDPQEAKPKS